MNSAFAEAVIHVNRMILDGYDEPIFWTSDSAFEQHYKAQMEKRQQCALTNEQIKERLANLNGLENNRQAQEQEKLAGLRKKNTAAKPLADAMKQLGIELHAHVEWNDGKKRFEVEWI